MTRPDPADPEQLAEGTLISHLLELRDRLLRAVLAIGIAFVPLAIFSNELFTFIARPLIDKLPEGTSLIATSVVSPFMAPLKLALLGALFVAAPFVLYQVWAFVAPGLYRREKRFAMPLFFSSVVLFYVGVLPAFTDEARPLAGQVAWLSLTYVTVATGVHAGIVMLASRAATALTDPDKATALRRVLALLLAAVAVWLLLSTRRSA